MTSLSVCMLPLPTSPTAVTVRMQITVCLGAAAVIAGFVR